MMRIYDTCDGRLQPVTRALALSAKTVRINLLRPAPGNETQVKQWPGGLHCARGSIVASLVRPWLHFERGRWL
jgi:hypothetical protein